jgi:hypothetical protein
MRAGKRLAGGPGARSLKEAPVPDGAGRNAIGATISTMNPGQSSRLERLCCLLNCPNTAVTTEEGELEHWRVSIAYCDEHARELRQGTPLGPVGIDSSRVEVRPKGVAGPQTGGRWEASPH